ncbi:MAG TPA: M4 family metallopeptidase, partial [Microterricola sp.]
MAHKSPRCFIVPPYLLEAVARSGDERFPLAAEAARSSLIRDEPLRQWRADPGGDIAGGAELRAPSGTAALAERTRAQRGETLGETPGSPRRFIADARGTTRLPGVLVREEGQPPTGDQSVNEAYDGLGSTYELFWEAFQRDSIDGANLPLDATVHYGRDYDNAFWNGERMVFGDGDGEVFHDFTSSLTVVGHELTHGVTEHTAGLRYQGQSGALNEHISDVFGALTEQFAHGQSAAQASWLIGAEIFTDAVQGRALRDMLHPGTAYDDDVLGRDPQPAHMRDYIVTEEDNGGVHLNSGIPNRAFALTALAIGGDSWRQAGHIWYRALTGGELTPDADFARFAEVTLAAAESLYGRGSAEWLAVSEGWRTVG